MSQVLAVIIAAVIWVAGAWQSVSPAPMGVTPLPPTQLPKVELGEWVYPNSRETGAGKWRSGDSPQVITDWYKSQITAAGLNTKSFVQTNTNGNVLNKLTAASLEMKVTVEISKSSSDAQTAISIELDK